MKRDDFELNRLLSGGGHLGRPAYDDVLIRVLNRTGTPPARWGRRVLASTSALAVVVVGVWLVVVPPRRSQDFVARTKGVGATAPAAIETGCAGPDPSICHAGATLMFKVEAGVAAGYLGAFAVREDDPRRERIWYFPTADGRSPLVRTAPDTVVLPEGVVIGPEHRPGRYQITIWISSRPLDRAEVDAPAEGSLQSRAIRYVRVVR